MKWSEPRNGEERIITRFLWWPVTIGYETRWLERARIKEKWYEPQCCIVYISGWWSRESWA